MAQGRMGGFDLQCTHAPAGARRAQMLRCAGGLLCLGSAHAHLILMQEPGRMLMSLRLLQSLGTGLWPEAAKSGRQCSAALHREHRRTAPHFHQQMLQQ